MNKQDIFINFLNFLSQIRLYHWYTMSGTRHKAFEELYEELEESFDDFVEITLYDRVLDKPEDIRNVRFRLVDADGNAENSLNEFYDYIQQIRQYVTEERCSIIDDIQTSIRKCLYKLTMS